MQAQAPLAHDVPLWRSERQNALSLRQMGLMFFGVALLLQVIGLGFALAGAQPILGFAWFELLVLGGALWLHARRARDAEILTLVDAHLIVEVRKGQSTQRQEFMRAWTQVHLTETPAPLVRIHQGLQGIHVGRFVPMTARAALVRALRDWIKRGARV